MSSSSQYQLLSSCKCRPFRSALRRSSIFAPLNRGFVKKVTWGALRARNREFVRRLADDPEDDFPAPIYATPDRVKEHLPEVCRVSGKLYTKRFFANLAAPKAA
jgi:hypothetical protein